MAGPDVDRGDNDLVRGKRRHREAYRRHVRHRVHRADLMKVDLVDLHAVHMALRLRDQAEHREHVVPHLSGQIEVFPDDMLDVGETAVMVSMTVVVFVVMVMFVIVVGFMVMLMIVVMVMVVMMLVVMPVRIGVGGCLLLPVDLHGDVRAGDAALDGRLPDVFHARDAERVQLREKGVGIGKQPQAPPSAYRPPRPCRSRDKVFS